MSFRVANRPRVTVDTGSFTFTKQSCKDECDVNNILAQYRRTGVITHINPRVPAYLDLPSDLEFQSSVNLVKQAEAAFQALPSRVRDVFGSDPQRFLAAIGDPSQRELLTELGIFNKLDKAPPPADPPAG